MIKNSEKFGLILLLCLSLTNLSGGPAFADNTLSQVDIRKNSTDGLEFTLYTSSPYADNVVVTKKSDNKYVILMPNVNSASGGKPDFSSAKDVITDVDVRAINDGAGGYTKVTVITNRPVNIKTNTAKTAPVTEGEREYRALIAQKKTAPKPQSPAPAAQKSSGFKLPEIQPTRTAADIAATKAAAKPAEKKVQPAEKQTKPAVAKQTTSKTAASTPKQDTNIKKVSSAKPAAAAKTQTTTKAAAAQTKTEAKPVNKTVNTKTEQPGTAKKQEPALNTTAENLGKTTAASVKIALPAASEQKSSLNTGESLSIFMSKLSHKIPKNLPVTLVMIFVPLFCLISLFNLIRNSLIRSQALKTSFLNNIARGRKPVQNYDSIINNENLSWQEKYQQYMDASGEKAEALNKENQSEKYTFITTPKVKETIQQQPAQETVQSAEPPVEQQPQPEPQPEVQINKSEVSKVIKPVENKKMNKPKTTKTEPKAAQSRFVKESRLEKLERMLHMSPAVEKTQIDEDITETENIPISIDTNNNIQLTQPAVSEDNAIHESMKPIKLKAFAEKDTLEETRRNKRVKHRRVQIELPKEGPHVNLGFSQLHTNPRMFKNANLSVSDLIATSNKLLNKPEFKEDKNDYEVISVDEYFNIMDDDKSKVTSSLSDVVANSLASMKPASKTNMQNKNITNPITKTQNETKADYLSGLIVKSGFNIDAERGFYLVSLDGKSAVVGRIGEEVFVLKKFDKNIDKPLQVRMDNPNVYMVKADDFKSLVEVGKDNMGVLIEL